MNKFKFRVWVKEDKKLYQVVDINFADEVIWVDTKGDNNIKDFRGFNFEDIILEPCIGKEDDNGVEICKGDVVKCFDKDLGKELIGNVIYSDFLGMYMVETGDMRISFWGLVHVQVLGNIHEVTYNE